MVQLTPSWMLGDQVHGLLAGLHQDPPGERPDVTADLGVGDQAGWARSARGSGAASGPGPPSRGAGRWTGRPPGRYSRYGRADQGEGRLGVGHHRPTAAPVARRCRSGARRHSRRFWAHTGSIDRLTPALERFDWPDQPRPVTGPSRHRRPGSRPTGAAVAEFGPSTWSLPLERARRRPGTPAAPRRRGPPGWPRSRTRPGARPGTGTARPRPSGVPNRPSGTVAATSAIPSAPP